ncbi:MAG: hypothetical protein EOO54_14025, partial [Haliea sp.]
MGFCPGCSRAGRGARPAMPRAAAQWCRRLASRQPERNAGHPGGQRRGAADGPCSGHVGQRRRDQRAGFSGARRCLRGRRPAGGRGQAVASAGAGPPTQRAARHGQPRAQGDGSAATDRSSLAQRAALRSTGVCICRSRFCAAGSARTPGLRPKPKAIAMPETYNAPSELLFPAAAAMRLNAEELRQCRANGVAPADALNCAESLNIGVFFDGTNNNARRDEPERAHSNIVRLFNAHPDVRGDGDLQQAAHYRIYVPGVGTPFKDNAELRESREGKAFATGGQARILYGVLEVFNAIHKSFRDGQPIFSEEQVAAKLKEFTRQVDGANGDPETPRTWRDPWLRQLSADVSQLITAARRCTPKPRVPE